MRGIYSALAIAILAAGAGHAAKAASTAALQLRPVAQGTHSSINARRQTVVRTAAEWNKLWAEHSALSSDKTPPTVDFGKEMVLAVFLGTRTSGGYSVKITDARVVGKKLVVSAQETAPGPNQIRSHVITTPFAMVAVKASKLPVEWKVTGGDAGGAPQPPQDPTLR
jgi:hypothetical protein